MRITLTKHGGLAAGIRRPPRTVDADSLPESGSKELRQLVASAVAAGAPAGESPGRARDAMGYTITVEDGERRTVLAQSDVNMTPAFAALLRWLEQH